MDTTTSQWPQGIGVVKLPMEGNTSESAQQRNNNNNIHVKPNSGAKPQKPQAINCPRCNSAHTKFCYYNNYSLTQPRYFCKTCRRYWTEGGSLRNVPVGGGSRKNKRSSSSASSLSKMDKLIPDQMSIINSHQNPSMIKIFHEGQDLNLAYPPVTNPGYNIPNHEFVDQFPHSTTSSHHFSQFLKSGGRGFSSFMSMIPNSDLNNTGLLYSSTTSGSRHPFQEFTKNSGLNFSLNQHQMFDNPNQGRYRSSLEQESESNNAKLFFPFEDLKQPPVHVTTTSTTHEHNVGSHDEAGDHHVQSSGIMWNGEGGLGGGAQASW